MIGSFRGLAAKVGLLLALSYPQVSVAEEFTGRVFLEWNETAQQAFLQNSVIMAATISSRSDAEQATCISAWFFDEAGIRSERLGEINSTLSDFPDYHPSAILVALIEQACGAF